MKVYITLDEGCRSMQLVADSDLEAAALRLLFTGRGSTGQVIKSISGEVTCKMELKEDRVILWPSSYTLKMD